DLGVASQVHDVRSAHSSEWSRAEPGSETFRRRTMDAPSQAGSPLSLATFAALVGRRFQIEIEGADPVDVELVEATGLPAGRAHGAPRREPFSLIFLGPPAPLLPQRIYGFVHEGLGHLEIFIVPIGRDDGGARYQAIFN